MNQCSAPLRIVGGEDNAMDMREQGFGQHLRLILKLVLAPGGGEKGQALGPCLGRDQQRCQR